MLMSKSDNLLGKWSGTSRLFFGEGAHDSESTAEIRALAQGQFISFSYAWKFQGEPQDGQIVFRTNLGEEPAKAAWLDSWHMQNDIMLCKGTWNEDGRASLLGSYSYPPGPDWGWRIEIGLDGDGTLSVQMFNITPEGQEMPAVQARYEKITS